MSELKLKSQKNVSNCIATHFPRCGLRSVASLALSQEYSKSQSHLETSIVRGCYTYSACMYAVPVSRLRSIDICVSRENDIREATHDCTQQAESFRRTLFSNTPADPSHLTPSWYSSSKSQLLPGRWLPGRSSWMRIPLTVSVHVEYLEPMKVCARAQSSCSMHREGRCKRACRCVRAGLPARCVCNCASLC